MDLCAQMFSFSTSTSILCWHMLHIREARLATAARSMPVKRLYGERRKVSDGDAEERAVVVVGAACVSCTGLFRVS